MVLWILLAPLAFRLPGFHRLWRAFPKRFDYTQGYILQSATPTVLLPLVWPLSISLAATLKIDVSFSSSAYLDVSVQRVSPRMAMDSPYGTCVLRMWVPPFGNLRVYGYLRLTAAYRSLSRPSSAPDAKAFALCSL